jgi:hypothetical protein
MNIRRSLLITTTVLASLAAALPAYARGPGGPHGSYGGYGGHGGGYVHHRGAGWGPGAFFLGAVGLGIGLNAVYGGYPYQYPYPGYVVVEPSPVVVVQENPAVVQQPSAAAVQQSRPAAAVDPVIYPRNGQSATQTDKDRQECVQWAVAQPRALADASVYQRAIAACMDGRGYSLR